MVDIWLIYGQMFPFIEVVLLIVLEVFSNWLLPKDDTRYRIHSYVINADRHKFISRNKECLCRSVEKTLLLGSSITINLIVSHIITNIKSAFKASSTHTFPSFHHCIPLDASLTTSLDTEIDLLRFHRVTFHTGSHFPH